MNASFGQWVKARRNELDLTPAALAERVGCAPVTLYKIEAGERRPSRQMAELLAEHLDIPPEQRAAFLQHARAEGALPTPPPANTLHLPDQPTPLIGREAEVAAAKKRLLRDDTRLLTLVGPPGIGKTRLAVQMAAEAAPDFRDGMWFVPLAPVSDAGQVLSAIVAALGLSEMGNVSPLNRLVAHLRDRHLLLVLDNCEHLLAAAPLLSDLLAACPLVKMLATSRAPLRLRREKQFPVPPLALPDKDHLADAATLEKYAALELFIERAQAVQPTFELTDENAPAVAAICARLDGLPLAIEILAARVRLLPPASLLDQLDRQFLLTADGMQDAEPRHRTLNAAVEWSYHLLTAEEQAVFSRLSVFAGGFDLEAAGAVAGAALSTLAALVDKSMVRLNPSGRYDLHDLLRQYGATQLDAAGETAETERLHFAIFLDIAEQAAARVYGPEQVARFDRLEVEHDNLRAALAWALRAGELESGLRLAEALEWFWHKRMYWAEAAAWCERLLSDEANLSLHQQARVLYELGSFALLLENLDSAKSFLERCRTIAQQVKNPLLTAWATSCFGCAFNHRSEAELAVEPLEQALAMFRAIGDGWGIHHALLRLAIIEADRGNFERAILLYREAIEDAQTVGATNAKAWSTFLMGDTEILAGHFEQAIALIKEAILLFQQDHDREGLMSSYEMLGQALLGKGRYSAAEQAFEISLSMMQKSGYPVGIARQFRWLELVSLVEENYTQAHRRLQHSLKYATGAQVSEIILLCLGDWAELNRRCQHMEYAAKMSGAVEALAKTIRNRLLNEKHFCQYLSAARDMLSDPALAAAWEEGRGMTLEQAVQYALSEAR
jgi:predicted ATPase/DNA-binding XRE family transcriptional regulator